MTCAPILTAFVSLLLLVLSVPAQGQVSFFRTPTYSGYDTLFVADFNGDGKPDILSYDGTLNLGNGDGTFTLGTPVSGYVLAVADFNGDGKPDVLEQGTGTLLVLLGNGDGTFQAPISTPSGAALVTQAAADLNGDGKADVVGVFNNSLYVYISNGDGTFKTAVPYSLGIPPTSAALLSLGDLNGDGNVDVAVSIPAAAAGVAGQVVGLLGNGNGTFQAAKISAGPKYVSYGYAAVGDFKGDGKLDLVLSNSSPFGSPDCTAAPCSVYLLMGNGDGTFQAPAAIFSGAGPLLAADLNGDGKLDLIFASDPTIAQVYLGNGDGTFSNTSSYVTLPRATYANASGPAVADFNRDGKLDVAQGNAVLLGNGNGTFQGAQMAAIAEGTTFSIATGIFEKNGKTDVAAVSRTNLYVLRNDGAGNLSQIHTYTLQQPGYAIVSADFNADGNPDLAVIEMDPATRDWSYSVLLGNGDGSFQPPVFYPQSVSGGYLNVQLYVADFNNDHKPDLAVAGQLNGQSLAILLGNGDGTFTTPAYYYDAGATSLAIADFNGDGKLDIDAGTGILYGNGDGAFQPAIFPANLNSFSATWTADFNNDGKPDLLDVVQVALGNGDGTFNLLPELPYRVDGIADFDGDGVVDLFVYIYGNGYPGVALGNGDGTFGSLIQAPGTTNIVGQGEMFVDMNGDGLPDIVFPWGSSSGTVGGVGVLLNTTQVKSPQPNFQVLTSQLSPAPVIAGNAATSTVSISPTHGFSGNVALSCTGLPTGANCSFNPASITVGSGTSTLSLSTASSLQAGSYSFMATGVSGSISRIAALTLTVQAAPDFAIGVSSGSPTSQTVSAGQSAKFTLSLAPAGSFTETVNLTCALTPAVTSPPSCTLSSSSVQISGSTPQTVTATVATTAPMTTNAVPLVNFPPGAMPGALMLLGSAWLFVRNRKRLPALAAPVVVLAFAFCVSCGGSGSPSSHTTPGTPAATYTATITATSGDHSHTVPLTVVVQ